MNVVNGGSQTEHHHTSVGQTEHEQDGMERAQLEHEETKGGWIQIASFLCVSEWVWHLQ